MNFFSDVTFSAVILIDMLGLGADGGVGDDGVDHKPVVVRGCGDVVTLLGTLGSVDRSLGTGGVGAGGGVGLMSGCRNTEILLADVKLVTGGGELGLLFNGEQHGESLHRDSLLVKTPQLVGPDIRFLTASSGSGPDGDITDNIIGVREDSVDLSVAEGWRGTLGDVAEEGDVSHLDVPGGLPPLLDGHEGLTDLIKPESS